MSRTDYNGVTSVYDYDALNRLASVTYPNATQATYAYDHLSRLTQATNASGSVTMSYDDIGRVNTTTDVWGQTIGYIYDAAGNRSSLMLGGATVATYGYDALDRLTSITDAAGLAVTYRHDAVDRLTERRLPNGVVTGYSYDNRDRLTGLSDMKGLPNITLIHASTAYSHDAIGNVTQASSFVSDATDIYAYDAADRLTSATHSQQPAESYSYDAVGNRATSHTYQPFNRLTSGSGLTFAYDANGNLVWRSGASGVWDAENRLTRVIVPGHADVEYKYDALGRRVERSHGGAATRYVYDGAEVVRDLNPDGSVTEYLNGLRVDEKLRQSSPAGTFYFTTDHLGSTTALTDTQGYVVERMTYDAFGNAPASPRTRYTYTGRERDEFTGLYYYRARWYDSQVGRFISEDPIGFAGGMNFYAYVGNNPINYADPQGLFGIPFGVPSVVGAGIVGEFYLHRYLSDRANNLFPYDRDPFGRRRHCYVNCMSTRIHLGMPFNPFPWLPGQLFSAAQEARSITTPANFDLRDTVGDVVANHAGSAAGYIIVRSCQEICTECGPNL